MRKIDNVFYYGYFTMVIMFFANGLKVFLDAIFWYDYIYTFILFFFTAMGVKQLSIMDQTFKEEATKQ